MSSFKYLITDGDFVIKHKSGTLHFDWIRAVEIILLCRDLVEVKNSETIGLPVLYLIGYQHLCDVLSMDSYSVKVEVGEDDVKVEYTHSTDEQVTLFVKYSVIFATW